MAETPNPSGQDRLTILPTYLLRHIVSFLPMHNVVQTCVLSKWWKNFWCSVPNLDISYEDDFYCEVGTFKKFVKSVLFLRDGSDIQNLRLELSRGSCDFAQLSEWIIYAVRHNLQVLQLFIDSGDKSHVDYSDIKLAPALFACASLRKLTLGYDKCLNLPASIFLPALKTLKLMCVVITEGLLDSLVTASPSLKTLIVETCIFECSHLTISASQLEKVTMSGSSCSAIVVSAPNLKSLGLDMMGSFPSVVIYAPNLVSLSLLVSPKSPASIKINGYLYSLTDAVVNIHGICAESALQFMSVITSAQYLSLKSSGRSCTEVLFSPFVKELQRDVSRLNQIQLPFFNLKCLRIETLFSSAEISMIHIILEHSPQIESLCLASTLVVKNWSEAIHVEHDVDKEWPKYELSNLKLAEIQGFKGSENEVKIVKFLLENAVVLENLVITVAMCEKRSLADNEEIGKIGKKLVRHPRASSSVGILYLR